MSPPFSASTSSLARDRVRTLLERLFPAPRSFDIRFWDGTEWPAGGPAEFRLVLSHPGALRKMLAPPIELSLGEAYIHGDFEIEGDFHAAFATLSRLLTRPYSIADAVAYMRFLLALPNEDRRPAAGRGPASLRGPLHSRDRDRAAVRYHYDVGNEFYSLWLDRRMQYSCAYFPTGTEDLDTAQELKLELLCRKLRLEPGQRLLDIGCGWGGLAIHAAGQKGVRVVGVTLSEEQARYAARRVEESGLGGRVGIRLMDYRDLDEEPFDGIVSVGMFEHIGRGQMPGYFDKAWRLLRPGGLFLNHGIAKRPAPAGVLNGAAPWHGVIRRLLVGEGEFSQRYIFPDSELVPLSEVNLVAERAGFEVRDVENLREHYARTLRMWALRLEERRDEAMRLTDETTFRTWRAHLVSSAHLFESAVVSVNQTLLLRPDGGASRLPPSRADLYAGGRA